MNRQPQSTHGCPGCGTQVRRSMLACRACWAILPADLRDAVNAAWTAMRRNRSDVAAAYAHRIALADALAWYRAWRTGATP